MKKTLKYIGYIFVFILIAGVALILIPLIINIILGTVPPKSFTLYGETADWHNFWAVYLGALIGATVPFIILYKTLKNNIAENKQNRENNKKENESNRKQSKRLREQEIELKWFDDLKRVCSKLYSAFNSNDVVIISDIDPFSDSFHNKIAQLLSRMNEAFFNFYLVINYHNNVINTNEVAKIQHFVNEYLSLLFDMDSLHIYGFILKEGLANIDLTKEEFDLKYKGFILNHKSNIEIPEITENRVWDLLIDNRFDKIEYIPEVLNILRKRIDNFPMGKVGDSITKLIKSEYTKIKEYDGTEQDK